MIDSYNFEFVSHFFFRSRFGTCSSFYFSVQMNVCARGVGSSRAAIGKRPPGGLFCLQLHGTRTRCLRRQCIRHLRQAHIFCISSFCFCLCLCPCSALPCPAPSPQPPPSPAVAAAAVAFAALAALFVFAVQPSSPHVQTGSVVSLFSQASALN